MELGVWIYLVFLCVCARGVLLFIYLVYISDSSGKCKRQLKTFFSLLKMERGEVGAAVLS